MSVISCQQRQFGILENGQTITCYSLRNSSGMTVNILNYGAILNAVQIPDLRGEMHQITLGPSQLKELQTMPLPSGSPIVHLPSRYGIVFNTLNQMLWDAESITQGETASIQLSLKGITDLKYSMTKLEYQFNIEYSLTATNELIVRSQIQTSIPLPIFMTHHTLWNLTGIKEDISDHVLQVWASHYSTLDQSGLINSEYHTLNDQPVFNFQHPQRIGEKTAKILPNENYDVCFQLSSQEESPVSSLGVSLAARVKAPVSGRILEIYTTQAGLRLYLESHAQNTPQGLNLSPMPLLHTTAKPGTTHPIIQQETCYKLIW